MGVKARVLEGKLGEILREEAPPGSTVVDLMSGTGVVAAFCAHGRRVLANDAQQYAGAIARSLIDHDPATREAFASSIDPEKDLRAAYRRNFAQLAELYAPALELERDLLARFEGGESGTEWLSGYRAFLELRGGLVGDPREGCAPCYRGASALLEDGATGARRENPSAGPACLVTTYYSNVYFGLHQAIALDSLRAAIARMPGGSDLQERKRIHYLSALLHAASVSTSGTSHFAQPRHLDKASEVRAMAKRRLLDPWELFRRYSGEILELVRATNYVAGNAAHVGEHHRWLRDEGMGPAFEFPFRPDVIYLDPPYTQDHYSRFYHVLEVLAVYDYPPLERDARGAITRGRYPAIGARFQSSFCSRLRVEEELRTVARAAARCGSKLVFSYATPSGLLLKEYVRRDPGKDPLDALCRLFEESYESVELSRIPLIHSGQGDKVLQVEELVAVCRGPRRS